MAPLHDDDDIIVCTGYVRVKNSWRIWKIKSLTLTLAKILVSGKPPISLSSITKLERVDRQPNCLLLEYTTDHTHILYLSFASDEEVYRWHDDIYNRSQLGSSITLPKEFVHHVHLAPDMIRNTDPATWRDRFMAWNSIPRAFKSSTTATTEVNSVMTSRNTPETTSKIAMSPHQGSGAGWQAIEVYTDSSIATPTASILFDADSILGQEIPHLFRADSMPVLQPQEERIRTARKLRQTVDLIGRVQVLFEDKQKYKKILACRDIQAQELLNMFQRLLDVLTDAPPSFRRNLIVATQRLAAASDLYPISYELSTITTLDLPECSGGFADIYKGDFRGSPVCVKTIRLHRDTEMHYFMKVRCYTELKAPQLRVFIVQVVSKEAVLWEQLRHPNLLPFYGIYRYKGRISLVAPWMENGTIGDYLKRHTAENRVVLAYDVAQGLKFLHKNGIIHGDLKGKNVLVDESGRACVADFGLSSISDKEILAWTSVSSTSSKGGTLRYQAPELLDIENGEQRCNTTASDIYAWACVAYEIFAGEIPFAHLTRELVIMKHVATGGQPTRPPASGLSWSVWGLTEDIWTLMQTCWNLQPEARPSVEVIINCLASSTPLDQKRKGSRDSLSPGEFRRMLQGREDEIGMTIKMFESLLQGLQ
ncbi:hypothetical protein H0H92_009353 [Tricholoma furcatifolium]|nr:hypothetical protein H0H92_009353 [Tricholoma furcatifolium]